MSRRYEVARRSDALRRLPFQLATLKSADARLSSIGRFSDSVLP